MSVHSWDEIDAWCVEHRAEMLAMAWLLRKSGKVGWLEVVGREASIFLRVVGNVSEARMRRHVRTAFPAGFRQAVLRAVAYADRAPEHATAVLMIDGDANGTGGYLRMSVLRDPFARTLRQVFESDPARYLAQIESVAGAD